MSYAMKTVAYVLITLFLGIILKELGFKGSKLVLLLGIVSVIGAAAIYLGRLISEFGGMADGGEEYTVAMLKIIGLGYVFGVCSDVCAELGEGTLGNAVCLFGRIEIVAVCAHFIKRIVEECIKML